MVSFGSMKMNCIKGECFQSSVGTEAYDFVVNIHYKVLKENIFCSEILASNYLAHIIRLVQTYVDI